MAIEDLKIYYQCHTLIDITNTGITKYSPEVEYKRNQQRNWETVQQLLGLRSQILEYRQSDPIKDDVSNYDFGIDYNGQHMIWSFEFAIEFRDLYRLDSDSVGLLVNDFSVIPVITNLDETAIPPMPMFYTGGSSKNIYFISLATN